MDAKQCLVRSIERILKKNAVELPDAVLKNIGSILKRYDVSRCDPAGCSMDDHVIRFIAAKRADSLSPKTLKDYAQQLGLFSAFVKKPSGRVTTDDVRAYITEAYDRGLEDSSVGTMINTLKSFFSWLYMEELIKKNPMLRIKPVRIDKKHLRSALTQEDIERLRLGCVSAREKAMFEVFYSSGCRLSELLGLDKGDVNFTDHSLRLVGKGGKERIVFFSARAKLCLQAYLASRTDAECAVFVSAVRPCRRLKERTVQRNLSAIGARAGVTRLHPHRLRHSFACHALESGMDITIIQALMGHDKLDTTQIYAKTSDASVKYAYGKLML